MNPMKSKTKSSAISVDNNGDKRYLEALSKLPESKEKRECDEEEYGGEGMERDLCSTMDTSEVKYDVNYRKLRLLGEALSPSEIQRHLERGNVKFGCVKLKYLRASHCADLGMLQRWILDRTFIGDLSSTIGLAPSEKTKLSIKQTQRTSLTRNELESNESMHSFESQTLDKDVMNVARSNSKSQQWKVDATATIGVDAANLSLSAGFSETATSSTNQTLQNISEVTQKSASSLKALKKTEVTQTSEFSSESSTIREISNPYRDRSLMINVYEMYKRYNVTTGLSSIKPSLVFDLGDYEFNEEFVLENMAFLERHLIDRDLYEELRSVAKELKSRPNAVNKETSVSFAKTALHLLYEAEEGVVDGTPPDIRFDINQKFIFTGSGTYADAVSNDFGGGYAILALYYRFYESLSEEEKNDWAIRIVIGMYESLNSIWSGITPDQKRNIMDPNNSTELLRRIPAFLSMVGKILKGYGTESNENEMEAHNRDRAINVIDRTIKHLKCYRRFYEARLTEYLHQITDGSVSTQFFHDVIVHTARLDFNRLYDFSKATIEGTRFIVPLRRRVSLAEGWSWFVNLMSDQQSSKEKLPDPFIETVEVPTDGVYLEATPGKCHLDDLPDLSGDCNLLQLDGIKVSCKDSEEDA